MDDVEGVCPDDSFDFSSIEFKKCAQSCLDYRHENILVTNVSGDEDFEAFFSSDLNKKRPRKARKKKEQAVNLKSNEGPVQGSQVLPEDVQGVTDVINVIDSVLNLPRNNVETRRNSRTRGRRKENMQQVPEELDSLPLLSRIQGRGGRRRSNRRRRPAAGPVVLNAEPIVIDEEPPFVVASIELEDSDLEGKEEISVSTEKSSSTHRLSVADELISPVENDNCEVKVKVWWRFLQMHFFNIRKYQKLTMIYEHFSQLENVPQECVFLTLRDTLNVKPTDTPDSLKLGVADIIEGGITSQKIDIPTPIADAVPEKDTLEFKLLVKDQKKPVLVRIGNDQNMNLVMIKCAEELELPLHCLKFSFDGEVLDPSATPADLDMEGGECIDVHIIK